MRWLLPAGAGARATAAGMGFYTPYRLTARLRRRLLIMALAAGWKPAEITLASRERFGVVEAIESVFPDIKVHLALAAGTPGPAQKPTVLVLNQGGEALAYGKVAVSPVSERLVSNEARMLRHINSMPRLRDLAPVLLYEAEVDGRVMTLQSPLNGKPGQRRMGKPQQAFLERLASGPQRSVRGRPFLHGPGCNCSARRG
jgi:hypothetical protein